MLPAPACPATHRAMDWHHTDIKELYKGSSMGVTREIDCHGLAPNGSTEVSRFPSWSVATQNDSDGHSMLRSSFVLSTLRRCQAARPPLGSSDHRKLPWLSTARQSEVD